MTQSVMHLRDYVYKTYDDDRPIEATVHFSLGQRDRPNAVALAIHGGAYCVGTRHMIPRAQIRYLVRNGFVVVSVDHRLCPNVSWAEGPRGDTRDAYHWCRNQLPQLMKKDFGINVDGDRVVAFGHSSGSHLALLLGDENPRPKALLDFYGTLYLDDPFWYRPMDVSIDQLPPQDVLDEIFDQPVATFLDTDTLPIDSNTGLDLRTCWMADKIKRGELISTLMPGDTGPCDTVKKFSKDFPPTFFSLGAEDNRRSSDLVMRAYEELKWMGVEVQLQLVQGAGHGYDRDIQEGDEQWEDGVQAGLDFLIRHV